MGVDLSRVAIRLRMIDLGFRWRYLCPIGRFVNTIVNVEKRQEFAKELIVQMEQKK